MIQTLTTSVRHRLPAGVMLHGAEPWMWERPLGPEEEGLFTGASEKRRQQFRAGRHCARAALGLAGWGAQGPILRGESGEPLWPTGFCGSITHSGEACLALAARQEHARALGVDIEQHRPLVRGVLEKIAGKQEQDMLRAMQDGNTEIAWDVLLFSIKESTHKVYYPLNRHRLGFRDVNVTIHPATAEFRVAIDKPKPSEPHPIIQLVGGFETTADYVLSWIVVPPAAG